MAYEMRISDWSSDVCSSDLQPGRAFLAHIVAKILPRRHCAVEVAGINPVPGQHIGREAAMRFRDFGRAGRRRLTLAGKTVGDDQVDAIGTPTDMVVDPRQFLFQDRKSVV